MGRVRGAEAIIPRREGGQVESKEHRGQGESGAEALRRAAKKDLESEIVTRAFQSHWARRHLLSICSAPFA